MRDRRGIRWVALCTAFSLFLGLTAVLTPSFALAEQAAADSQENQVGGVIDAPGYAVDGIKWTLSKDGILRISSEDQDRSLYFEREELPWSPYCPQVKKVVIGPGITTLASNVFEGYTSLESVEFCEGIVEIYNCCFKNCINLTEIILPESLQEISSSAFSDCTSLISVDLPDSVRKIGDNVFENCTSLETIDLSDQVKEIGNYVFENCTSLTTVNLPKQMKRIGSYAFYGCDHLKTVRFPETLGWMDTSIFRGCKALEAFRVPNGLTILPELTFCDCENLKELIFPETLAKIGSAAVGNVAELTSVHFPASVKQIDSGAFSRCEKLSTLYFDGNAPDINESAFQNVEATAFYPSDDVTWTEEVMQNYGGTIRWIPWDPETGVTGAILISDGDVALASDQIPLDWSWNVLCPEITVVCEGKKLVPGTDYDLIGWWDGLGPTYMLYPGSYQIKIVGKGKYCGTVKKSYEIVKRDPELQFASSYVEKQTDSPSFINELTGVGVGAVNLKYTSSDPAIASVDSSGYVTIHVAGVVDITVNSRENEWWEAGSASYRLNISEPSVSTPTKTPPPSTTALPTGTLPETQVPTETQKPAERTPDNLVQATTPPGRSDSASSPSSGKATFPLSGKAAKTASGQKRSKLPKPRIVLKKGKSKTGMRYIKIKVKGYKGKYVQIYLRQKNKKYKRIKLASSVLKRKKSFKLAYTHRKATLWFRVRTYSKQGGKRVYSPYSRAKRIVL